MMGSGDEGNDKKDKRGESGDSQVSNEDDVKPEELYQAEEEKEQSYSMKNPGVFITEINNHDVLQGRGSGSNLHPGNVTYRNMIEAVAISYVSTASRKEKNRLIMELVRTIHKRSGRFLHPLERSEADALGLDPGKEYYVEIRDEDAVEKAKQAIRYVHYKKRPLQEKRRAENALAVAGSTLPTGRDGSKEDEDEDRKMPALQTFVDRNQPQSQTSQARALGQDLGDLAQLLSSSQGSNRLSAPSINPSLQEAATSNPLALYRERLLQQQLLQRISQATSEQSPISPAPSGTSQPMLSQQTSAYGDLLPTLGFQASQPLLAYPDLQRLYHHQQRNNIQPAPSSLDTLLGLQQLQDQLRRRDELLNLGLHNVPSAAGQAVRQQSDQSQESSLLRLVLLQQQQQHLPSSSTLGITSQISNWGQPNSAGRAVLPTGHETATSLVGQLRNSDPQQAQLAQFLSALQPTSDRFGTSSHSEEAVAQKSNLSGNLLSRGSPSQQAPSSEASLPPVLQQQILQVLLQQQQQLPLEERTAIPLDLNEQLSQLSSQVSRGGPTWLTGHTDLSLSGQQYLERNRSREGEAKLPGTPLHRNLQSGGNDSSSVSDASEGDERKRSRYESHQRQMSNEKSKRPRL